MAKRKGGNIKSILVAIFLVALVLLYFNYLNNRTHKTKNQKTTELETLLNYDMLSDYPKSARDVVKLHCRYFKQLYGVNLRDEDIQIINGKMRNLYCNDLLAINSENSTLISLKNSIDEMQKNNYSYNGFSLPESSQIKYYTQKGLEMASMEVTITLDDKKTMENINRQYILVKENNQWKIYGWGESQLGD